ncbi:MAG: hypothetical protein HQL32_00395 [Planctomycetes bacterium]|nr:hypothetical protein [Planctomycetota bacterium]
MKKYITILIVLLFSANLALIGKEAVKINKKPSKVKITWQGDMALDTKKNVGAFEGDVVVTIDDLTLNCDKMEITYEEVNGKNDIRTLKGEGNVKVVHKLQDITALSDTLDYDHKTGLMIFRSKTYAHVTKSGSYMKGPEIYVNVITEQVEVKGDGKRKVIEIDLESLE